MSARKADRQARGKCRTMTTDELAALDKTLHREIDAAQAIRCAVRREIRRRRSARWAQ